MAGPILPPNAPLIDGRSRITPEWYRFLVAIQKRFADGGVDLENATIFATGIEFGGRADVSDATDGAMLMASMAAPQAVPDIFPPLAIERSPEDHIPPLVVYADATIGLYQRTRAVSASFTPYANDVVILADATAGAITVNLPTAAMNRDRVLICKKTDAGANAVTIDPSGSETIDGAATLAITTQYQSYTIQCDGMAWWVI